LQPHGDHWFRAVRGGADLAAAEQDPPGPERARGHPEPQHGRLLRRAHRSCGHARVRPGLRHRRPGWRRTVADRQCRPRSRSGLHHRLLPGGGARRRRPVGRQRLGRLRPRRPEQNSRTADWRRAGQDPHPRADHSVYPETPAGPVRPQREGHRLNAINQTLLARASLKLGPRISFAIGLIVLSVLLAMPLLHLLPGEHALHVSAYSLTLVGKILCYAIVALALDLVWGYAGL